MSFVVLKFKTPEQLTFFFTTVLFFCFLKRAKMS